MTVLKPLSRRLPLAAAVLLLVLAADRGAAQYQGPASTGDPVEDLRLSLTVFPGDSSEAGLENRKKTLLKRVAALRTLGELRRALMLTEWKDTTGISPKLEEVDREVRKAVGDRLKEGLEGVAARGAQAHRVAVATMIGEMGVSVRGTGGLEDVGGYARTLVPTLVKLSQDADPAVRVAALAAIGKVNPPPAPAAEAIKRRIQKDDAPQRRAATDALINLVRTVAQLQKSQSGGGIKVETGDVIVAAQEVVPVAALALNDPDVYVRRFAQEALLQAVAGINEVLPQPFKASDFPAPGRIWSDDEVKDYQEVKAPAMLALEQKYLPVLVALQKQGPALAKSLGDPDTQVRVLARRTLEATALARARLRQWAASLPARPDGPKFDVLVNDRLLDAIRPGMELIAARGATRTCACGGRRSIFWRRWRTRRRRRYQSWRRRWRTATASCAGRRRGHWAGSGRCGRT
jgi:hypothetical protein